MGTVLGKMGLLSIAVLLSTAAAYSAVDVQAEPQLSEVQVSWLTTLSMEIKIGRNQTYIILLTPASNIPGMPTPCLFSGRLLGDPRSVVAVSGCLGDEETSLSIASTFLPGGIVDISLVSGESYEVTADEAIDVEDYDVPPQGRRKRESEDDFLIPPPSRSRSVARVFSGPLPTKVVLETDIKYDNSLLGHFDGSHTKTMEWIRRVVELAKPSMSHSSLAMPITLKTGRIDHTDVTIKASSKNRNDLILNDSPTSLTSYFCEDVLGESRMRGLAVLGSACNTGGYAVNINELYSTSNSELKTARNFVHQLGHNVGMKHDHDEDHGGRLGPCNKEGLMSYGSNTPDKWTECSNKDFTDWWRKEGHACVKAQEGLDEKRKSTPLEVTFTPDGSVGYVSGSSVTVVTDLASASAEPLTVSCCVDGTITTTTCGNGVSCNNICGGDSSGCLILVLKGEAADEQICAASMDQHNWCGNADTIQGLTTRDKRQCDPVTTTIINLSYCPSKVRSSNQLWNYPCCCLHPWTFNRNRNRNRNMKTCCDIGYVFPCKLNGK